jgi:hypothetical protein
MLFYGTLNGKEQITQSNSPEYSRLRFAQKQEGPAAVEMGGRSA